MFSVRRITIKGRRYTLRQATMRDACGQCDHPSAPGPEIRINKRIKRGELLLDTLIHEVLHASNWDLSEEFVDQFGSDMARILWRLGYRGPWDQPEKF